MHTSLHAVLLILLLAAGTDAGERRTARSPASDVATAIDWRRGFMPDERLAVDACAVETQLSAAAITELQQRLRAVVLLPCGTKAAGGATVWKLSGVLSWEGGRRVDLAVDITTARTTHREHYMIEDGEVKQVTLSAFGHYD